MAVQNAIIARLQTPVDENGQRKDIFLRTNEDAIECSDEKGNKVSLKEKVESSIATKINERIEDIKSGDDCIMISDAKPERSCLWVKVSTDEMQKIQE